MYSTRTVPAREVLEEVQAMFGERVFDTVITSSIRFAEAALARMPILEYAPGHPGAKAYRAIAKEVLNGRAPG
jgi:chromosome partitioning protein